MDAGDSIHDNSAEIFVNNDDVHPMIQAINALDYDVWVTGNHDYDYGLNITKKTIADLDCKVLTGNVYDENGEAIADGYTIFDMDGVRVAMIGMVTPNIIRWDAAYLKDCTVNDPLEETRAIIDSIRGQYDILVGVYHMGIDNEYEVQNSGVTDILENCPEFDVMVSAHEHTRITGEEINGALVVQNKDQAQTMSVIDLTMEKTGEGWTLADRNSESIDISVYEADPAITDLLSKYDEQAKEDAKKVIGKLAGGPLVPENAKSEIPIARIMDTPLMDLVNRVQIYYADAQVSAAPLSFEAANLHPGDIRKCDIAQVYKFNNTLYKIHMTGGQLKKYMERSASYFNTFHQGDMKISVDPDMPDYLYHMFEGVYYDINISMEPGSRIENLTWPDGRPVEDDDEFDMAINNYSAVSEILSPGVIFEENDMPVLVDTEIRGDIGGLRELIRDFIVNVKGGTITPEVNGNWKITGYDLK